MNNENTNVMSTAEPEVVKEEVVEETITAPEEGSNNEEITKGEPIVEETPTDYYVNKVLSLLEVVSVEHTEVICKLYKLPYKDLIEEQMKTNIANHISTLKSFPRALAIKIIESYR